MSIPTHHDKFIRGILADKGIALDYFRACLPGYVLDRLDFSTLTQLPDTYVSKELRKTISDIVYSCQRKDGKGEVKISLLIEHKSYVDAYTPIQVGSYIFSGLLKQISNREKPSLIIPVLLYHGKERWEYRTLSEIFEDLDPELKGFVPDYEYIYHNLGEISDEQIQALHNKFLSASFLALKYSLLKAELENLIPTILALAGADGVESNLYSNLIVYIFESSGLDEVRILAILEKLPIKIKDRVMSTLDIFVEKGIKIGEEKGIKIGEEKGRQEEREKTARNLIKISNLSDEQIATATDLSLEHVARLRKEVEGEQPSKAYL